MALAEGSRLGPYEIGASIGAGGMGEVYRARDTRLDRDVAIKVLPAAVSSDADARARLTREARALSQLSHPHICALYDVGEHGDTGYIVMELVDGETLAARIARGPLPLAQTVEIGAQIADALARAHRAGIVHRDLKPANVMLTPSGAKLLDFGLARTIATFTQNVPGDRTTLVHSNVTAVGTVVGTIQYMSPEQIEGRAADARSDIFALGVVLFEMATGRRAFEGGSSAAIAAAILSAEPPTVSSLETTAPAALDRLVRLCLEKNPDARWQSAHDVSVLLRTTDVFTRRDTAAGARRDVRWLPWLVAAAAAGAALLLWLRPDADAPLTAPPMAAVFGVPPPRAGFTQWVEANTFALSPDGSRLAFVKAGGGVWVHPLTSLNAAPVAGAENANTAFWSPDGRSIAFFGFGKLSRIDAGGGGPVPLCNISKWTGHAGTWGNDGIVFSTISTPVIFRVPTAGGDPVELIKPDPARREFRLQWPHFLPDGRRLLYTAWREDRTARLMLWEPGKPVRDIMPVASKVEYVDPGYLLFVRDGTLLAQRFDASTATIAGDPVAVAQPVNYQLIPGVAHFTTSRNGVLAYQAHWDQARVARFDGTGRELGTALRSDRYGGIRLTPDGRHLLFWRATTGVGTYDLWTLDLARGSETRLTSDPGNEVYALTTADRSTLVYSAGPWAPRIQIRDAATGAERPFRAGTGMQIAEDLTADGQTVIFRERDGPAGTFALLSAPLMGGDATAVVDPRFTYLAARLSPDGKWLAYVSDEAVDAEVYVVRWPGAREKVRVSTAGAFRMRWGPQGRELFYLSRAGLMRVPMSADGPGKPQLVIDGARTASWGDFDVASDGSFVAMVTESLAAQQPLTVMVNWPSRLK